MSLIIMHIIDKNTVLHDNSNKYQRTDEVVISYKGIKRSIWTNTETQYDNIKFARLVYYHNAIASRKQKTFSFPYKTAFKLHFINFLSFPTIIVFFMPQQASIGCNGTIQAC